MALESDIVIIGAGAAGAAATWRLATQGLGVVCLEQGDWFAYAALSRNAPDWELVRQRRWSSNPNVRKGPADYPIDDADSPIKPALHNGVGGSTIYWAAHVPRFHREDFRMRTCDGVGEDWPIGYEDLAPWYDLNERMLAVAGLPGDPSGAPHGAGLRPPAGIGACGRRIATAFDSLGWHWWPVDLALGRDEHGRSQACTHAGPCELGCPGRRRAGADRTYWPAALAAGARLVTRTRVLHLEHDAAGCVTAAVCAGDGGTFRVRGRRFLLAANGIGTPRLMLLSASGRFPNGLGNGAGLVGRHLMLHPYGRVYGRFAEPLGTFAPGAKAGIVSHEFYATKAERGFLRGCKLQLVPGPGPLALALGAIIGAPLPWGAQHHDEFARHFDRLAGLTVCVDDLPNPDNRITLSERLVDRDGQPAPKMIYKVDDNARRALDFGLERAGEVLRGAGADHLYRIPLTPDAGFHLMGTARMGADPERSVTDPFGRCHEVPNLHVIDSSLFVTAASANPTHTAQALALRISDHIAASRGH